MDQYILGIFFQALSVVHYFISSKSDVERLKDPNTTSYLYNYSLSIQAGEDGYYKQLNYLGYPHDTFAIHFIREKAGFMFYLQCLIIAMAVIFILMVVVLVWYFLFDENKTKNSKEFQNTLDKLRIHHEQLKNEHGSVPDKKND